MDEQKQPNAIPQASKQASSLRDPLVVDDSLRTDGVAGLRLGKVGCVHDFHQPAFRAFGSREDDRWNQAAPWAGPAAVMPRTSAPCKMTHPSPPSPTKSRVHAPLFRLSLAHGEPDGGRVGHDVAPDGLHDS